MVERRELIALQEKRYQEDREYRDRQYLEEREHRDEQNSISQERHNEQLRQTNESISQAAHQHTREMVILVSGIVVAAIVQLAAALVPLFVPGQ